MHLVTACLSLSMDQWLDLVSNAHIALNEASENLREAEDNRWTSEAKDCRERIMEAQALRTSLRMVKLPGGMLGDLYDAQLRNTLRGTIFEPRT